MCGGVGVGEGRGEKRRKGWGQVGYSDRIGR